MLNENSVDRKRGQGKGICPDSWLLSRPSASLLFYYHRASTTFKVKGNNSQKRYHALDTIVEISITAISWNSIMRLLDAFRIDNNRQLVVHSRSFLKSQLCTRSMSICRYRRIITRINVNRGTLHRSNTPYVSLFPHCTK